MRRLLITISLHLIIFALAVAATRTWLAMRTPRLRLTAAIPSPSPAPRIDALPTRNPDLPEHLTPYEIRSFINANPQGNLSLLWQRLKIKTINVSESQQLEPKNFSFLNECANCQAETFEYDLDNEIGNEVLVKVQDEVYGSCRYLIFKEDSAAGWRLLGHIDETLNKYRMSQHLVALSGGRSWLVITGQGASGSGIALYVSRLFLVTPNSVREIFVFTSDGHQAGIAADPPRDFYANLVSCEIHDGTATAEINFAVRYYVDDYADLSPGPAFAKRQKAVFVRRLGGGRQRLDAARSELTDHELEEVYQIDSLTNERFLKYNYAELSVIARGRDGVRKAWLRRFLTSCDDTLARRNLRAILKRS